MWPVTTVADVLREKAKSRVLDLLRQANVSGDLDALAGQIIKAILGVKREYVPPQSTCVGCGRTKVPIKHFRADPSLRAAGCVQHGRGDYCSGCYMRQRRGAVGPADPARAPYRKAFPATAYPVSRALIAQLRMADPEYCGGDHG